MKLAHFIGRSQQAAIRAALQGEEKDHFHAKMEDLKATIRAMPKPYETDGQGMQATAHLHYFTGSADFYITERDDSEEQMQAFGLADIFGDGGELGYISIQEIKEIAEIDLYWTPKTLQEVRS